MFLVMCLRLSDQKVFHNIASSSRVFRFHSDFLAFFARISYLNFFEFKELNNTIIPFALLGYETGGVFIDNCSAYTQLFQLFQISFRFPSDFLQIAVRGRLRVRASVLSTRFRFDGREFSKCAFSELKTRTRSHGPRPPI